MNTTCSQATRTSVHMLLSALALLSLPAHGQTLDEVTPRIQRVHDFIELEGSGFGTSQGASSVRFTDGTNTWVAPKAYLWRDNFIKVRVPVGNRVGGSPLPIAKTPLQVFVQTAAGTSGALTFQVVTADTGTLAYRELTDMVSDQDVSSVLGSPNLNYARSKDADLADVNGDGYTDILDNNSSNIQNDAHGVLRINNRDKTFTAVRLEARQAGETGTFATTPTGGDYLEDETSYDADMFDANGDRLPDIFQTASKNPAPPSGNDARIRILMNVPAAPGSFIEDTDARLPPGALGTIGCPDDLDHTDVNNDGELDFLITMRTAPGHCSPGVASVTHVFLNRGGGTYDTPITLDAPPGVSTHDAFFIDVNNDGFEDLLACHEFPFSASSQLFLHDGSSSATPYSLAATLSTDFDTPSSTLDGADASAGVAADFNGDGFDDFALAHEDVFVFLNDPDSPGDFQNISGAPGFDATKPANPVRLQPPSSGNPFYYDLEAGDVDLDGDVDLVGASLRPNADSNMQVWLNNGDGSFVNTTLSSSRDLLPDNAAYQRLTADMLDFDLDGDLDLYIAGADGTGVGQDPGFGKVPNQFFENLLIGLNIAYPLQSQPAYAGSATGGRKVLVRLRANTPIAGLAPVDFLFNVDGADLDAAATVTGAQIEEEFWLLVQMPAKPDGCYPLQDSMANC
ncbi:MAG: FG-GAP-like repeat-containing protein [Pseudomonadota bacterium]